MDKYKLLCALGKAIREHGKQEKKKHGSYWYLTLKSGIKFTHDDYNKSVTAFYPDGTRFYYGMDFGDYRKNLSMLAVSDNNFISTIELIESDVA
jgi:hypothetical protein